MIRCPECKKIVDEKNNSCQYCGYPFNGTEEKITIKYCNKYKYMIYSKYK